MRIKQYGNRNKFTVDPDTGCWNWWGCTNGHGYGMLWLGDRMVVAHRYFYESKRGPIPSGLELDHLCKNKSCVNPKHLEAVTHLENIQRFWAPSQRGHHPKEATDAIAIT